MWRQIRLLTGLELCNLYGINVVRHTKDSRVKKRSIAMAAVFSTIILVVIGYVCGLCYGLAIMGAADIIPAYLVTLATIVTLMFTIFKTGSVIFRRQGYEIMTALPISKWAVVISRFFRLYVENIILILIVMIPGMIVYGIFNTPSVQFYLIGVCVVLVVPLFPVSIASGVGALITAVASRTKHKSLVEAGISVLLVVGILLFTVKLPQDGDAVSMEILQNMVQMATEAISSVYPPAIWLGKAMVQGKLLYLGAVSVVFIVIFVLVVSIVSVNFHKISRSLYGTYAKHNYQMGNLRKSSVLKALVIREARRYFASGVYVSNTIIGPIMGTAMSVALLFVDFKSVTESMPIVLNINAAVPFVIGAVFVMMNNASVSISMEGKEVWILKSLPLSRKAILDSKILFNLCLCAPFYIVSIIMLIIALKPSAWEILGIICIPIVVIVFSAVFGITMNLLLPKMTWENEVEVVKQSASAMIGGIGGALIALVGAIVVLVIPTVYVNIAGIGVAVLLMVVTGILYCRKLCE